MAEANFETLISDVINRSKAFSPTCSVCKGPMMIVGWVEGQEQWACKTITNTQIDGDNRPYQPQHYNDSLTKGKTGIDEGRLREVLKDVFTDLVGGSETTPKKKAKTTEASSDKPKRKRGRPPKKKVEEPAAEAVAEPAAVEAPAPVPAPSGPTKEPTVEEIAAARPPIQGESTVATLGSGKPDA